MPDLDDSTFYRFLKLKFSVFLLPLYIYYTFSVKLCSRFHNQSSRLTDQLSRLSHFGNFYFFNNIEMYVFLELFEGNVCLCPFFPRISYNGNNILWQQLLRFPCPPILCTVPGIPLVYLRSIYNSFTELKPKDFLLRNLNVIHWLSITLTSNTSLHSVEL